MTENQTDQQIQQVIEHQGWDADSLVSLYQDFIQTRNLDQQWLDHLRDAAATENGADARQALEKLLTDPGVTGHEILGPAARQLDQPADGTDPLLVALADALEDRADVSEENGDQEEARVLRETAKRLLDPRYLNRVWDHAVGPFLDQLPEKI